MRRVLGLLRAKTHSRTNMLNMVNKLERMTFWTLPMEVVVKELERAIAVTTVGGTIMGLAGKNVKLALDARSSLFWTAFPEFKKGQVYEARMTSDGHLAIVHGSIRIQICLDFIERIPEANFRALEIVRDLGPFSFPMECFTLNGFCEGGMFKIIKERVVLFWRVAINADALLLFDDSGTVTIDAEFATRIHFVVSLERDWANFQTKLFGPLVRTVLEFLR